MFVLTVQSRTSTPDALRQHLLRWPVDVGTSAMGWLGNTAGASADGDFVLLMRFQSEEAALVTGDLPEYGRWWRSCARLLDTKPLFTPSINVTGILSGGTDAAAAVQITRGRAAPARLRDSLRQFESLTAAERGTVVGGIVAWHDDNRFTEALYFIARISGPFGQQSVTTPLGRFNAAHEASMLESTVIDLRDPWLTSPPVATSRAGEER